MTLLYYLGRDTKSVNTFLLPSDPGASVGKYVPAGSTNLYQPFERPLLLSQWNPGSGLSEIRRQGSLSTAYEAQTNNKNDMELKYNYPECNVSNTYTSRRE